MSKKKWGTPVPLTPELIHKMTTGMTVKGTSTGRFTRRSVVIPPEMMPSGEPGMVFCDDEVEAVKHLTGDQLHDDAVKTMQADGLEGQLRTYGKSTMNLYHWSSRLLKAHGQGDIIVMAENVEKARDKVYAMFDPLEDGGPFEDSYLQMLAMNKDEDYMTEYMKSLNVLREDLNKEPTIVSSDVVLIRGSD